MEQFTEGDRTVNVVGGFAGWFDSMGGAQVKKWKSAVAVLLALIPTSLAVHGGAPGAASPTCTRRWRRCSATSSGSSC